MSPTEVLRALIAAAPGAASVALIGGVARNAWAPPRDTTDLDLAVAASPEILASVEAALVSLGYACVSRHRVDAAESLPDTLIFRSSSSGLRQVDLLVAKSAFEASVLERARRVEIAGVRVPIATPEDLIVYKLIADRSRDRDDIRTIVRTRARAGEQLDWVYVEGWAEFWEISDRLATLRAELSR